VHQLEIKVMNIIDAQCNHEVYHKCFTPPSKPPTI